MKLGIDDAGRGPVLGPMVLAGILLTKKQENKIKKLKVKDSKLLSPTIRKKIGDILKSYKHHIKLSTPQEIDNHKNLNLLEAEKCAKIINTLTKNLNQRVQIIIDCPSTNIPTWTNDVQKLITKNQKLITISAEHKADYNHPIVSAASILAKEKREDEIYRLKLKYNIDFGSGYPADPKTIKFIKQNFNNPKYKNIIRHSWNTVKKLKEGKQEKLF